MLRLIIENSSSTASTFSMLLACVLSVFICMTVHEFSHALAAVKHGDPTPKAAGRLSLNPIKHIDPLGFIMLMLAGFGFAKPVPINPNNFRHYKRGMVATSLAGVLSNIIMAFIASLLLLVVDNFVHGTNFFALLIFDFFFFMTLFNISLFIFNLLPIYPLDGFNFVLTFVKDKRRMLVFAARYGIILMLIVIVAASYFIAPAVNAIANGFLDFWRLVFGGVLK